MMLNPGDQSGNSPVRAPKAKDPDMIDLHKCVKQENPSDHRLLCAILVCNEYI